MISTVIPAWTDKVRGRKPGDPSAVRLGRTVSGRDPFVGLSRGLSGGHRFARPSGILTPGARLSAAPITKIPRGTHNGQIGKPQPSPAGRGGGGQARQRGWPPECTTPAQENPGRRIGVLLQQPGTPDARTRRRSAIPRQLLERPRVVERNRLLWWFVLRLLVYREGLAGRRRSIGRSGRYACRFSSFPRSQAARSKSSSNRHELEGVKVALGMRYGNPSILSALKELIDWGATVCCCFRCIRSTRRHDGIDLRRGVQVPIDAAGRAGTRDESRRTTAISAYVEALAQSGT